MDGDGGGVLGGGGGCGGFGCSAAKVVAAASATGRVGSRASCVLATLAWTVSDLLPVERRPARACRAAKSGSYRSLIRQDPTHLGSGQNLDSESTACKMHVPTALAAPGGFDGPDSGVERLGFFLRLQVCTRCRRFGLQGGGSSARCAAAGL